MKLSTILYH